MEDYRLIDEKEIYNSFKKVIKPTDTTIVLYSGIWSFINKINFKKNIGKKILDIVENLVTPKRTLIIPSFSSDTFLRENKYRKKDCHLLEYYLFKSKLLSSHFSNLISFS